jgi:molybdopterin converting factor small subunit
MISVKFFAEIKETKQRTESTRVFFNDLDEAVASLIELNREKILNAMPTARVVALITNEGDQSDQLFV